jgi:hypothetical protein
MSRDSAVSEAPLAADKAGAVKAVRLLFSKEIHSTG